MKKEKMCALVLDICVVYVGFYFGLYLQSFYFSKKSARDSSVYENKKLFVIQRRSGMRNWLGCD